MFLVLVSAVHSLWRAKLICPQLIHVEVLEITILVMYHRQEFVRYFDPRNKGQQFKERVIGFMFLVLISVHSFWRAKLNPPCPN